MPAHRAATERVAVLAFPAFVLAIPRVRGLSGSTSTIGGSTTATHSPDQTLTSPLPPGCLLSAPHRLTPPGSQLRPRHAHSRSTWVHCQDIHAHLHHLAPCTPRAPLFSAYSVARPCGVCFAKSDSYLSILPVALRHGGLICSLGDFKTSGRGGFLIPSPLPIPRMRFHVHACVFSARW